VGIELEAVMENQTKDYGAPEMKRTYLRNFRRGLEFAIILHIVLVSSYMIFSYFNSVEANNNIKVHPPIDIMEIGLPPSVNDDNKPPEKPIDEVKPMKDPGALIPEPVAREKADQLTTKTQDELDKITVNVSKEGDSVQYVYNPDGNGTKIDKQIEDKIDKNITKNDVEDKNYSGSEVDKLPECINFEQVKGSIVYPQVAIEANIEGRVTVRVLVGADGKVIKTGSISGPDVFYDEVNQKAKNLEFTPGLMSNKPVNVWVTVPFSFKFKN
jgi:protein TonB